MVRNTRKKCMKYYFKLKKKIDFITYLDLTALDIFKQVHHEGYQLLKSPRKINRTRLYGKRTVLIDRVFYSREVLEEKQL